jgi:hypothetical protein
MYRNRFEGTNAPREDDRSESWLCKSRAVWKIDRPNRSSDRNWGTDNFSARLILSVLGNAILRILALERFSHSQGQNLTLRPIAVLKKLAPAYCGYSARAAVTLADCCASPGDGIGAGVIFRRPRWHCRWIRSGGGGAGNLRVYRRDLATVGAGAEPALQRCPFGRGSHMLVAT